MKADCAFLKFLIFRFRHGHHPQRFPEIFELGIEAGSPADIDLVAVNAGSREYRDGIAAILAQDDQPLKKEETMRIKTATITTNYELSGPKNAPVVMLSHSLGST